MASKESASELIRAKDANAFDRWSLPSFDPDAPEPEVAEPEVQQVAPEPEPQIEEVPVEDVKPLTLDELEAIRQDAYNEGFATGERDGFHAGQLKARQEADAALAARLAQLETLMAQLLEPIAEQDRQIEESLVHLTSLITRQVIQRELRLDSSQIRHVLREALKLLPMGAGNVRIHVNPQDFEQVKALRERHEESWRILEDEALEPGGCRVETEHSRIDASIETRLNQAMKQLFEQQREQKVHPPAADRVVDLDALEPPRDAN
ncbi:flagellar assembly protein FliH [Metapseudomonas furukawaii]|uniref:Flagellar assembly protein FliH n=1 Tax=Metapseudomonas furukawaii TaxID=1149133 RepID=A0AAD1C463_METFU|nr:flagellar assembly protein FliH [Pseudomonas furukawaii]ELS29453.1 Flagellar assembly protein FliH [Pseudomonas furukawaii]BAU75697.1 flagellar assembly protein FliH [Pseudomonas furukawaii]